MFSDKFYYSTQTLTFSSIYPWINSRYFWKKFSIIASYLAYFPECFIYLAHTLSDLMPYLLSVTVAVGAKNSV